MHLGGVIFLLRAFKLQKNLVIVQMLAITYFLSQFFFQVSLLLIKIQKIFRYCVALAQNTDFRPLIPGYTVITILTKSSHCILMYVSCIYTLLTLCLQAPSNFLT